MAAMKFSELPDDILDIVFEKLDIREKFLYQPVSRKWSDIIFNTCTKFDNFGKGLFCTDPDHLIIPSVNFFSATPIENKANIEDAWT